MNYTKRAFTNIKRNYGKYGLLFGLILILGSLVSGAISIQRAVQSTEERLIATLPAMAVITSDWQGSEQARLEAEYNGEEMPMNVPITAETIHRIGELPYVRLFNYTWNTVMYSTELTRYINRFPNPEWGIDASEIIDSESLSHGVAEEIERYRVTGIHGSQMLDIDSGLIELTEGRLFEDREDGAVVWISRQLAEVNNLAIGSTISLSSYIFGEIIPDFSPIQVDTETLLDSALFQKQSLVEVIGIFELIPQINADNEFQNVQWTQDMLNRIYAPNAFVQSHLEAIREAQSQIFDDFHEWGLWWQAPQNMTFLLNDPRDLRAFSDVANEMLPFDLRIDDLTSNLNVVFYSMNMMNWIANLVLYTTIGATVVIISLLVVLFLRDRTQEIGLYLALGEKKLKIMVQVLVELFVVALASLSLALVVGNFLSDGLARMMLQNDLLQQEEKVPWILDFTHPSLAWHNPGEVSIEEMLELYDTSLDSQMVVLFYGISGLTILVSAVAPLAYTVKLNPKKILM